MNDDEAYEHFCNKKANKVYVSKVFADTYDLDSEQTPRLKRFISGVVDDESFTEYVIEKGSIVLRTTPKEREEIKLIIIQDSREINELILQRFRKKNGRPISNSFHFGPSVFNKLIRMLLTAFLGNIDGQEKMHIRDEIYSFDEIQIKDLLLFGINQYPELIEAAAKSNITNKDIKAIAYRKEQLKVFSSYLTDNTVREPEWQKFFEDNQWVLGYGLSYVFSTSLDDHKLEQVVSGFDFNQGGKRADSLLKTRGALSSFALVEIKTPQTELINRTSAYRKNVWSASSELTGGIAQAQKTSLALTKKIIGQLKITNSDGFPTGEIIHSYLPKSYLIIGRLDQFIKDGQINEEQFGSFELLRRNIGSPEIITYDELYERAKFIIKYDTEPELQDAPVDIEEDVPF